MVIRRGRHETHSQSMPTYSREDFKRIAAAIGKSVADVGRHEKQFEAAAMWHRLYRRAPKGKAASPSATQERMKQIASDARKLLRHLAIYDYRNAPDGPGDIDLLAFLASAEDGEDEVVRATARIGRLVEVFEAFDAARDLERLSRKATEDATRFGGPLPKGRRGKPALNIWIADMMSIYKKITGKEPRASVVATGPNSGKATGPFIRFLAAASKPLATKDEPISADSLRERVRAISTDAGRQK